MNILSRLASLALLITSSAISATEAEEQCGAQPAPPGVPEGDRFSETQLRAAKVDFLAYQEENAVYLDCLLDLMATLQAEISSLGDSSAVAKERNALELEFALSGSAYNKAVGVEDASASELNKALEDFKEKYKSPRPCS